MHEPLHDVLGAYACYRPDIGYVRTRTRTRMRIHICILTGNSCELEAQQSSSAARTVLSTVN